MRPYENQVIIQIPKFREVCKQAATVPAYLSISLGFFVPHRKQKGAVGLIEEMEWEILDWGKV